MECLKYIKDAQVWQPGLIDVDPDLTLSVYMGAEA